MGLRLIQSKDLGIPRARIMLHKGAGSPKWTLREYSQSTKSSGNAPKSGLPKCPLSWCPYLNSLPADLGGRIGAKMLILEIFSNFRRFFVTKLRQSAGNRSQMFYWCLRDECGRLARVPAPSGLQKPRKFAEITRLRVKSLTVP